MREALGNADGVMPIAARSFGTIAILVLILFATTAFSGFHRDDRGIVTASATDRYVASVRDDSPVLNKQDLAGNAEADGKAQQQGDAGKKEPEGNVQDLTY
jgi:hypothetical protein